jgi:hypothetical protein
MPPLNRKSAMIIPNVIVVSRPETKTPPFGEWCTSTRWEGVAEMYVCGSAQLSRRVESGFRYIRF